MSKRTPIPTFRLGWLEALLFAGCALLGLAAAASHGSVQTQPRDLVRQVIQHELTKEEQDHSHWMYLVYRSEPGKTEAREVVETQWGDLSIVLAHNGQKLRGVEHRAEIARLRRLSMNPGQQKHARENEHDDGEKAQQMLRILPDAFQFEYEERQGDEQVFAFHPEPRFQPSSREATVFHHMAGTLTLNLDQRRLVALRGHLIGDVEFGMGILGRLKKGGWFSVRQDEVAPGYWELTRLDVEISGKALLFKTISLHQREQRSDFRRVPDKLTLPEAAAILIRVAGEERTPAVSNRTGIRNELR